MERVTKGLLFILAFALTATIAKSGREIPKKEEVYSPDGLGFQLFLHPWLGQHGGIFPGFGGRGGPGGGFFPGFGGPGGGIFPGFGGRGGPGGIFPGFGGLGGFPGFGGKGVVFPSKSLDAASASRWGNTSDRDQEVVPKADDKGSEGSP
ncbi:hypothetical protein LguiA_011734 [Lonicera macranthoides]